MIQFLNSTLPIIVFIIFFNLIGKIIVKRLEMRKLPFELIYGTPFLVCLLISLPIYLFFRDSSLVVVSQAGIILGIFGILFNSVLFVLRKVNEELYKKIIYRFKKPIY